MGRKGIAESTMKRSNSQERKFLVELYKDLRYIHIPPKMAMKHAKKETIIRYGHLGNKYIPKEVR